MQKRWRRKDKEEGRTRMRGKGRVRFNESRHMKAPKFLFCPLYFED